MEFGCCEFLSLIFFAPLTNAGDIVPLYGRTFECDISEGCADGLGSFGSEIKAAAIIGTAVVPLPAALWLFMSALFGGGLFRRLCATKSV